MSIAPTSATSAAAAASDVLSLATGSRHHQAGVASLSLFLQMLEVRLISPHKVALRALNPFPNPVRLRRRRLKINWEGDSARVHF